MKRTLLLIPLLLGYASSAATFPGLPAYDPFANATSSGGSTYAIGATLAAQTNAMGQIWYAIDSNGPAVNSLKVTASSLNYNNLAGFSGSAVMLTNAAGPGARMFFPASAPLNVGVSYYYSVVLVASNINNLSTTGQEIFAFGTQTAIGNQTTQPTQGAALWMRQVGTSPNFQFQLGLTPSGNPGTPTFDSGNSYNLNQVYFIVVGVESGDLARLWVNPDPATFGAAAEPTATYSPSAGNLGSITCFQMYDIANAANNLYVASFRMGTNWAWVTAAPAIAQQPVASTNVSGGTVTLTTLAMLNGTPNGYQWQFNGANLADGTSISGSGATVSGSTTASLMITGMASADAGNYTVVVTNAYGAVTSAVSSVTTFSTPVIMAQPVPTSLQLYAGVSNTISLTAVGAPPLAYYWYSNTTLIPSVTGSSFFNPSVQANGSFYCVVSNSLGRATSSVVSLTVLAPPTFPYPLAVFNDRPIGYWPLTEVPDDTLGNNGVTAYDYFGGDNGTYTNVVLGQQGYGSGLAGQYGYSFPTDTNSSAGFGQYPSGSAPDSYVGPIPNINFGSSLAPSFSIEAWANAFGLVNMSGESILNKGYGGAEQFTLDYTTAWRFFVHTASGSTVTALSTNHLDSNWHHLVGVADAIHSNLVIYVDGLARTTTPFNPGNGLLNSANPVVIGSRMSSASSDFNDQFYGGIQGVAIYGYALTATQIANHYYAAGIAPTVVMPSFTNVNEGTTLVVPAAVTGSPLLSYQWYDLTSGSPGTALPGQTNATLVISNISSTAYDGHLLGVTVTNLYGQASASISLQVVAGPPNSVVIMPSAFNIYAGLPVAFTVTAQGAQPFYYQWSTNGAPVPGATNAAYTIVAVHPGAYTIGCQVTNRAGPGPAATASLTVVAAPADFYGSMIVSEGPVAFWRLDEPLGATTAFDYVGGHNATYNNASCGQPGFSSINPAETSTLFGDNSITPSLASEDNNVANGIPLIDFATQGANAQFSVEVWVKEPTQGQDVVVKGSPNNTQFAFDGGGSGGAFRFVIHTSASTIITASAGSVVPDNNWHHLVGVCDEANGAIRMYADGSLKATTSVPPGSGVLSVAGTYPVIIAANGNSSGFLTNAYLSQVALYPYAMQTSQVVSNYNAASFVTPTISAALSGTTWLLTYTGTLVSSTNAAGPFSTVVSGATSPYTVPATNTQMFFRSRSIP